MAKWHKKAVRGGFSATMLYAGAALLIAAPSAGLAFGAMGDEAVSLAARGSFASFTPAAVDPRLAQLVAERSSGHGKLMRFTPAGAANRPDRSVTVAVRVDEETARAISVRQALSAAGESSPTIATRITPTAYNLGTRYNLGISRNYQSFARTTDIAAPKLISSRLSEAAIPDLASFQPSPGVKEQPSRFNARIALDLDEKTGRAPRTREALGDQSVDVAGSYSLTRNLDVTAGVRYSQERDRLDPLSEGRQDSQAVYVGTQFRF